MIDNNMLAVICILLLVLLWHRCGRTTDGFESKPSAVVAEQMATQMMSSKNKFRDLEKLRQSLPWMDAITYEDGRRLIREGNFTKQNILDILG